MIAILCWWMFQIYMGFWDKHSVRLGFHSGEDSFLFAIPCGSRCKKVFANL